MSVIAYDKPVKDFVDELSGTGHVTHTAYRKTSVTIHHNGGRLSHEGVLNVWRTRPASAHFDVDAQAALAQYVKVNEYAWAAGNTLGNQSSIHIEMANSKLAPNWEVSETTWREAARLAGWLFAKVIGVRPNGSNLFYHHHWSATACAGPYMDSVYDQVLYAAQAAYDSFTGGATPPPPPAPTPSGKSIGDIASEVIAGEWGNGDDRFNRLRSAGYDPDLVQAEVNHRLNGGSAPAPVDKSIGDIAYEVIAGEWGNGDDRSNRLRSAGYDPVAVQAEVNARLLGYSPAPAAVNLDKIVNEVIAGYWGNGPDRSFRLASAGYNAGEVQAAVNARLGGSQAVRPSLSLIASQVIAGQWGNGEERVRRLTSSGYDANAVQAEVNRQLS